MPPMQGPDLVRNLDYRQGHLGPKPQMTPKLKKKKGDKPSLTPQESDSWPKLARTIALKKFAALTLFELEREKTWSADTLEAIASYDLNLDLGEVGPDGNFRQLLPRSKS